MSQSQHVTSSGQEPRHGLAGSHIVYILPVPVNAFKNTGRRFRILLDDGAVKRGLYANFIQVVYTSVLDPCLEGTVASGQYFPGHFEA